MCLIGMVGIGGVIIGYGLGLFVNIVYGCDVCIQIGGMLVIWIGIQGCCGFWIRVDIGCLYVVWLIIQLVGLGEMYMCIYKFWGDVVIVQVNNFGIFWEVVGFWFVNIFNLVILDYDIGVFNLVIIIDDGCFGQYDCICGIRLGQDRWGDV